MSFLPDQIAYWVVAMEGKIVNNQYGTSVVPLSIDLSKMSLHGRLVWGLHQMFVAIADAAVFLKMIGKWFRSQG